MDNTIKIASEILIHEYYDLERAFRKILKSIGSYTFDYNKIDDFVEMVDYNGIEYIINGFYHNNEGNIFHRVPVGCARTEKGARALVAGQWGECVIEKIS